jgi:DNA-binding XRE family transcriptional regulator
VTAANVHLRLKETKKEVNRRVDATPKDDKSHPATAGVYKRLQKAKKKVNQSEVATPEYDKSQLAKWTAIEGGMMSQRTFTQGERVLLARRSYIPSITQEELARAMGCTRMTLGQVEGNAVDVSVEWAEKAIAACAMIDAARNEGK